MRDVMAALSPLDTPNLKEFTSRGALQRQENRVDPDHKNGAITGLNRGLWVRSAFESSRPHQPSSGCQGNGEVFILAAPRTESHDGRDFDGYGFERKLAEAPK